MSVVDDLKGASILCKVAFVLLLIASMFTCISYTTTSWGYESKSTTTGNHWGLWRRCGNTNTPSGCASLDGWANDWYGVVQAFVTFGFFGTLVTFFLIILYIFVGKCQKNGEVGMAAGIIGIVTGILYLIGCIIFAAKWDKYWIDTATEDYKLGYSFALSIVALLLEIVGAVLMIVEGKGGGGGGGGGGKTQASA